MIERDDVMPLLLAACPSFQETWREIEAKHSLEDDEGEENRRLHYSDAGRFAHHLVELHRKGATAEIAAAMQVIERLHLEGEHYVQELATIGYLEDIQNVARNSDDVDPAVFVPYLGPESRRWWNGLNEFWHGGETSVHPIDDD